jgi:hypothetical protein
MRALRRLHADSSGQILVFLVFAAVLMLGFVVVMIAAGQRVLGRQQVQDAADAGAFGAAVVRARALNLLALTNLLQAAFLAVVVALTLVADVLAIVAGALSAICASSWITGQVWACGLVPTAWNLQQEFSNLRDRLRPEMTRAARALMPFQDAVRELAPAWASAEAVLAARENAGDARVLVLPLPTEPLPVERRPFHELCDRAMGMVVEPIRRIPPRPIFSRVAGWVEDLLGDFRGHYCGEGGGGPSSRVVRFEMGIPERPTDPPTPGAGCEACRGHDRVKRYFVTRAVETWEVVRRPGQAVQTTARRRGSPEGVEADVLPCAPACGSRPHCAREDVSISREDGAVVERHRRAEWVLDACVVEAVRTVGAGEPLASDVRPMGLQADWARSGRLQARAFVREGEVAAGRILRLDAWRTGPAAGPSRATAVAQAEVVSVSGDLWSMEWRARLRRFRLPRDLPPGVDLGGRQILERLLVH